MRAGYWLAPWAETMGVFIVAVAAVAGGLFLSKARRKLWVIGVLVPLSLVVVIAFARRSVPLSFAPPFSWATIGRREFLILGFAVPMLFSVLVVHMRGRRAKWMLAVLAAVAFSHFSLFPFLMPALTAGKLSEMETIFESGVVCLQNTGYTCGPAAAVTALRELGIEAKEGEIAVLARSSAVAGTDAGFLGAVLERRFAGEGLVAEHRKFESVEELEGSGVVIATIKFSLMADHYVAVLGASDGEITLGDPAVGERRMPYEEFARTWRFSGIVLTRRGGQVQ